MSTNTYPVPVRPARPPHVPALAPTLMIRVDARPRGRRPRLSDLGVDMADVLRRLLGAREESPPGR